MINLFVYKNFQDINTLLSAINDNVILHIIDDNICLDSINDANIHTNVYRMGIMFDSKISYIPFGSQTLKLNNYDFVYFKKELYDYILRFSSRLIIDVISCNLGSSTKFIDEVKILESLLPSVKIQYSLREIGGGINNNDW